MRILRNGSRGHDVEYMQRLLVRADVRDRVESPFYGSDGIFGPQTEQAVRALQRRRPGLTVDGVVGPRTWTALGLRDHREHPIRRYGQPTGMTCWSAAATMILGSNMSVGQGSATTGDRGGLNPSIENVAMFGRGLGWSMPNHTPTVAGLVALLMRTPLWLGVQHSTGRHAVVLSGVYSDGDASGAGTMVRIHDPWPVGQGAVYTTFVNPLILRNGPVRYAASLELLLVPR